MGDEKYSIAVKPLAAAELNAVRVFDRRGAAMKTLALEDADPLIRQLESNAENEPVMLTRGGKPVACVLGLRQYDAEDLEYITDPEFWKMIRERRADDSDAIPLEEIEAGLAEEERRLNA